MAKFAAIGTDGTRPVVWGLGDTEEAALVDAGLQDGVDGVELRTEPVSDVQASKIEQGVVDWKVVCSYTDISRAELAAVAQTNNELVESISVSTPSRFAIYTDPEGNTHDLSGDDIADLADQLPDDYSGPRLTVRDAAGSVRGWIGSRTDWTAQ